MWDIGDKLEHDPLNNNNYIYIFRNIKTPNYVIFLLCVGLIYQSWMFVLLMMAHVGPMIRQYNVFYSILFYSWAWRELVYKQKIRYLKDSVVKFIIDWRQCGKVCYRLTTQVLEQLWLTTVMVKFVSDWWQCGKVC